MTTLAVPDGVRLRTGLLVSSMVESIADGATGGDIHRVDLGPGFVVGIMGVNFRQGLLFDADADQVQYTLSLDPGITLTTQLGSGDARIAYRYEAGYTITTDGASYGPMSHYAPFPAPIFTVRDFVSQVTNNMASTGTFEARVYYAIYEVTDAQFLRIAGVSLSRG